MTELNQVLNEIAQDIKELFKRIDDVDLTGSVPVGASVPAAGTLYNHLEDNGAAWISVSDLNLDNDARLYFGAAQESSLRRVSASNRLEVAGENWYFNGPSVGIGVTPSAILETQEAGAAQVRFTSAGAAQVVRMALADSGQEWQVRKDASDNLILFDATATSSPLTIENAAPSNSIYVEDTGAVGIRSSTPSTVAEGLHVLWIAGDADATSRFGSTNAANNQNAIEANSFSGYGILASSDSLIGVAGVGNSGIGIDGESTSGIGGNFKSATGVGLSVNLTGIGVIADFNDNNTSVLTIQDGGQSDFAEYIRHLGDTDTSMRFQANQWTLDCGGVSMIDATSTLITLGGAGMVVPDDFYIGLGAAAGRIVFDNQATDEINILTARLGVGTSTPSTNAHFNVATGNYANRYQTGDDSNVVFQVYTNGTQKAIYGYLAADNSLKFSHAEAGTTLAADQLVIKEGLIGIGAAAPGSLMEWNFATEDLEFVNAGSAGATEQDWIEVQVGGVTGYIRVYAAV